MVLCISKHPVLELPGLQGAHSWGNWNETYPRETQLLYLENKISSFYMKHVKKNSLNYVC